MNNRIKELLNLLIIHCLTKGIKKKIKGFYLNLAVILIIATGVIAVQQTGVYVFNVREFGVIGDGETLNTQAIQKAIDACTEAGGGTVYFPAGTYKAGTFYLKSNVTLYLDTGATILGSKDMKDYVESEHHYGSRYFFIYGRDIKNVSIVGGGIIDGTLALDNGSFGPLALIFEYSENILIRDISIINSAGIAPCIHYCNHVDIIRVKILDSFGAAISTSCCQDLLVDGVLVDSPRDDPLVLKNEGKPGNRGFLTKDVVITNTTIRNTSHGAIKIGTGTAGVFRNIVVSNCTFENTGPMFLLDLMRPKKKETTERLIENITFANIVLKNVACSKWLWLEKDESREVTLVTPRYYKPQRHKIKAGTLTTSAVVKPTPPAFEFGDMIKINSPAEPEALTTIIVPLKNIGGREGTKNVLLYANEEVVASKKVTLSPGEETEVKIEHVFEETGPHNLKIADFPTWHFTTFSNTEANFYQTREDIIIEAGGGQSVLWSEKEEYTTAYLKDIKGDFVVTMYLQSQTVTGAYAEVGFMVRNDITSPRKSPGFVILCVEPKYGAQHQWRADLDGDGLLDSYDYNWAGYPIWFKLEKRGNTFTGYTSPSDTLWYKNDVEYNVASADSVQDVGIYATAFSVKNELNHAVLQHFKLEKPIPVQFIKYSNLKISRKKVKPDESFTASATVKNTSSFSGPVKIGLYFDNYEPYVKWLNMDSGESSNK